MAIGVNVTGRIVCDTNHYLTALTAVDKARRKAINGYKRLKNVRVSNIPIKDTTRFQSKGADINAVAREAVTETARYARGEVYRLAYVAPAPYVRYGKTYQPKTLAKRSYAFTLPENETPKNVHIAKVSFYNNAATGWFGEVAVLWEYGSPKTPAHPMVRPAMELSKDIFRNAIKYKLKNVMKNG